MLDQINFKKLKRLFDSILSTKKSDSNKYNVPFPATEITTNVVQMYQVLGTRAMFNRGPIIMSRNVGAINVLSPLQMFADNTYENHDLDTNNFAYI